MTDDVEPHYKGEFLNCVRNGRGSYRYEIGGNGLFNYDGQWSQGHKNGSGGKFTMKGIHQVTGDFRDGEITGHGVKTWSDGRRYEGSWLNGEMHGKGDWISSDGNEMYCGNFKDNKREGFGVVAINSPSSIYRGNFSRNKRNGFGTYLCPNSVFVEANFVDNLIHGEVKIKWQKMANLVGNCSDGIFDGSCYYCTADGSYEFDGRFTGGFPLPSLEATYVYVNLDRRDVLIKVSEEAVPVTTTPCKKTPIALKKSKVVEAVEVQQLQVQLGSELGKIIVRAGTQRDIDDRKRRVGELAEAALLVSTTVTSKTNKATKLHVTAPQELDIIDPNSPPPAGGRHTMPKELQRNVVVRIRPVISAEHDLESAFAGTSTLSSTSKSVSRMMATLSERVVVPDTFGPAIEFWVKKSSQDKFCECYKRFPISSFACIGGVIRRPVHSTADEVEGGIPIESLATFTATSSARLTSALKTPGHGDMTVTSYELTSPFESSAFLVDDSGDDLITKPSVAFRVPHNEITGAAVSVSFIIDFRLNKEVLLDEFIAMEFFGENDSESLNEGKEGPSQFVSIPVLTVKKEILDGVTGSPLISNFESTVQDMLQLFLMVPVKHFKLASSLKKTRQSASLIRETDRLASKETEAQRVQGPGAISEAATNTAATVASRGSPKGRKSTPTRKKIPARADKDKESTRSAFSLPDLPVEVELKDTVTAENVPDIEWTDCIWHLCVVAATLETNAARDRGVGNITNTRGSIGLNVPTTAGSMPIGQVGLGTDCLYSKSQVSSVQHWSCGTFQPSSWHSLALTARKFPLGDSAEDVTDIAPCEAIGDELGESQEDRILSTGCPLGLILDGYGLLQTKLSGDSTALSSVPHVSDWLVSDSISMHNVTLGSCTRDFPSTVNAKDVERDLRSMTLESTLGLGTDEPSLHNQSPRSLVGYTMVVSGEKVRSSSIHTYGLRFQGAVKTLSVCGSGDHANLSRITSCFADWRFQEADWPALKVREAGGALLQANPPGSDVDLYNETAACEVEMALRTICATSAAPVPSDCRAVREVVVSLISGFGEFDNILLPSDVPTGKYVIEVSDGVSRHCLRYPPPDSIPADSIESPPSFSRPPTESVPCRPRETLEGMKDLFALVRPVRVNRHIIFHAVSVVQPVA